MKIQVASDLHLEFLGRKYPDFIGLIPTPEAELLVLAGDIHVLRKGALRLHKTFV